MPKPEHEKIASSLDKIWNKVSKTSESTIRLEESTKGIWKELRGQKRTLETMPLQISEAVRNHAHDCPVKQVFLAKAAAPSAAPVTSPVPRLDNTDELSKTLLKSPFFIALASLGVVVGTIFFVLYKVGFFN